jgi:dynamin 1-like protein
MVTRCPLVLQLVQTFKREDDWAEFGHLAGRKFVDFELVREEIVLQTDRLSPENCVCGTPITLKIFSPKVLNLTLVDLPGLVTTPIAGQPADIAKQISTMVKKYVSQSNTLILAISAANQDIATSAGLQMAKEVDPSGDRTLGVLTKLDLMDSGTDAMAILKGHVVPLRRGFIAVVNRSQKDINDRKNIVDAREAEARYFQTHPVYSQIAPMCGTEFLTKTLNKHLLEHIHAALPELTARVDMMLAQTRKQMEKFGSFEPSAASNESMLYDILTKFVQTIKDKLERCPTEDAEQGVVGGARIEWIFCEHYAPHVHSIDPTPALSDERIRLAKTNMNGMDVTLFANNRVFRDLAGEQILLLQAPSTSVVQCVHDELLKIVRESASAVAERFPALESALVGITFEFLSDLQKAAKLHIQTIILSEHSRINAKHPEMVLRTAEIMQRMHSAQYGFESSGSGGSFQQTHGPGASSGAPRAGGVPESSAAQAQPTWARKPPQAPLGAVPHKILLSTSLSDAEKAECRAIRELVCAYFKIVRGNVTDQVPKAITLLVVDKLKNHVAQALHTKLNPRDQDAVAKIMSEPEDIVKTRTALKTMEKCLARAYSALLSVKEVRLR